MQDSGSFVINKGFQKEKSPVMNVAIVSYRVVWSAEKGIVVFSGESLIWLKNDDRHLKVREEPWPPGRQREIMVWSAISANSSYLSLEHIKVSLMAHQCVDDMLQLELFLYLQRIPETISM